MAVLSAVTLLASPAGAEAPADVVLSWSAPAGCPDEAYLRAAVERIAGRALRSPGGPRIPVRIEAMPSEGGAWTVRIAIEPLGAAAPRERRLDGPTCAEVADAAAVVVAVAIAQAPAPTPPAPVPVVVEPGPDHAAQPAPAPELRPGLRVFGGMDFASLPAPSFGVEVAAVLVSGADRVEVRGSGWLPEQAMAASPAMAGAHVSLVAAGARYCRALVQHTIDLGACAGVEAGALLGNSFGVTHPASGAAPWVAPDLGVLGLWNLTRRFSLALELDGLVPLVRESFQIGGVGAIYRPPPVTGRALLGLELHFR